MEDCHGRVHYEKSTTQERDWIEKVQHETSATWKSVL